MIDWLAAARWAALLGERPRRTAAALAAAVDAAPCFRNTDYPLSPLPLFAVHADAAAAVPLLERYVALLGRIAGLYHRDAELRRWYGLGPVAEGLIAADRKLGDDVVVCRLDGYLEQGSERLRLLENNADAPAGTLFSPRINNLVDAVLARAGATGPDLSPLTFRTETALLDVLLAAVRRAGLDVGGPRVGVLQLAGRANRESAEMVRAFEAAGVHAVVVDPREIHLDGDRVRFGSEPVDVCWNKVNTVGWRTAVEPDADLCRRWVAALRDAAFVHVNPFGARYVAESKLTLALPRDPRFAGLFDADEHELFDRLVPWTRRLTAGALADDGRTPLHDDVLEHPARYVVKEPYDIRGDGVTMGRSVSRSAWRSAVAAALEGGLAVQRYVAPTSYPVLRPTEVPPVVAMPVSFDTFLLGGRVCGFGSKAGLNSRLNVFQGGQKLAVHVLTEQ